MWLAKMLEILANEGQVKYAKTGWAHSPKLLKSASNFAAWIPGLWQSTCLQAKKGLNSSTHSKILEKGIEPSLINRMEHNMLNTHQNHVFHSCFTLNYHKSTQLPWFLVHFSKVRHVQPDIDREALWRHRLETLEPLGGRRLRCGVFFALQNMGKSWEKI